MKRITAFVIITALILSIAACSGQAPAQTETQAEAETAAAAPAGAVDYSPQLGSGRKVVIEPGDAYLDGEWRNYSDLQIVCEEGARLTVRRLRIDNSGYDGACAISFTGKGNCLIIEDDNIVESGSGQAGVRVEDGTELTISGGGWMQAMGGDGGAGIGGSANKNTSEEAALKYNADCGKITITGASLYAAGGSDAAGIGGGIGGDGGVIEITGGYIEAEAYGTAAAIGGGGGFFRSYETDNEAGGEAGDTDEMNFIDKGNAGLISITGGAVIARRYPESPFYPVSIGCGEGGGGSGRVRIGGGADVFLDCGYISEHMDVTIEENAIVYVKESGEGWSREDEVYFEAAKENDLCGVAIQLTDTCRPLYIVDSEGNRRNVLDISDNNAIEALMPKGTYYIEYANENVDYYKPSKITEPFDVKGDTQVTLDFRSVATETEFTCRYMDSQYVYNTARLDLYENPGQTEFELDIPEGHTAHLWATTPYTDVQFYLNGVKCGDDIVKTDYDEGGVVRVLRLDTAVEVKPGKDVIELKAVAGDGVSEEVYLIHTTSPLPFTYTAWFLAAAGLGAAALLLMAALAAGKKAGSKDTAKAPGTSGRAV